MKTLGRIALVVGILSLLAGKEVWANNSLQSKIDSLPDGGTLQLKKGSYHEKIIIKKPINLIGEKGTVFSDCTSEPVITIKGEHVKIKGVKIKTCKEKSSIPVIYLSGKNNEIEDITIETGRVAVKLENAEKITVKNIKITGMEEERGFDLWYANFNIFKDIKMDHVQDGFYMENSHFNTFIGNQISDSRYGLHVMFSDNITIKNNVSERNFTGAMVMGTSNSLLQGNKFIDNNQNVNAQGLLLYDVRHSIVHDNTISNNRVGMYMEDSSVNDVKNNRIIDNFIGAQLNQISHNKIINNLFIGNVSEIQALKGSNNLIKNNYWDASWKLDTDGNGFSNLAYHADPYFLNLVQQTPEYQLFFQDPGMVLLQKMLKSPNKKLIIDESPLMKYRLPNKTEANQIHAWKMSLLMIMGSLFFIFIGRKKS